MARESFLDKLVFWFKNNKFFAVIMLLAIFIVAAANVLNSLYNMFEKGTPFVRPLSHGSLVKTSGKEKTPEFGEVILKFGSTGIGPGMFTDPREIAVDGNGQIYVVEWTPGGRLQVFDPTGKFITEWSTADKKSWPRAIAANRHGIIYAADGDTMYRYEGETGKLLEKVHDRAWRLQDVKTKADGSLIAGSGEDLIVFDSNLKVIQTIHEAIRSHSDNNDETDCDHVAVDGLGNIYVMKHFGHAVYKFSSDGRFVNRFGASGNNPGQLNNGVALAVDGKGRVYVGDFHGILVFDSDGRYIATFNVKHANGVASGMIFNDKNELLAATNADQVVKFRINDE